MARAGAVLLGLAVLGMAVCTVVLDSLVHTQGSGGPVVDALAVAAVLLPAAAVATLLAARRPRNPIGWLLFVMGGARIRRSPCSSSWDSARCRCSWAWRC